ncbi:MULTISPECIES: GNAT family N-acetyltransferase [unclassified Chitinophaga]|uniref:GNAT family N-acetyltransferase n=1 Tax=unclassified Chitinophaga TaxID=2619133 RepID=UPI00300FA8E6
MKTFPELYTNRLKLRKVATDDLNALVRYANNKKISENILNITYPYKEGDAAFWIDLAIKAYASGERVVFAINLKELSEFIGAIGLRIDTRHNHAELGYWIGEPFWGKGLMTEAVKEVLKFGFGTLHLHKIFATVFTDNRASERTLINNGLVKEGELVDQYKVDDVYKTVYQYRLTKQEYEKATSPI